MIVKHFLDVNLLLAYDTKIFGKKIINRNNEFNILKNTWNDTDTAQN